MGLELPSVYLRQLNPPRFHAPLTLRRTPPYLRFVMRGANWDTLDALDQLDDTPADDERIIAAVQIEKSMLHIDGTTKGRGGRRTAWWVPTYTYEAVHPQPPDEVMRDTERWRAWCWEQRKKKPA